MAEHHFDMDAEESLLGSMLLSEHEAQLMVERVKPDDFYVVRNAFIFEAIRDVLKETGTSDVILVRKALTDADRFEPQEATDLLADLGDTVPTAHNAGWYAHLVSQAASRRRLSHAMDAAGQHLDGGVDLSQVQQEVLAAMAATPAVSADDISLSALIDAVDARVEARATGQPDGAILTGIGPLDWAFRGLMPGRLTVLGASTGTGKTALATQIAGHVAVRLHKPVLIVSAEMARLDLCENMLRQLARVQTDRRDRGTFHADALQRWRKAQDALRNAPWIISDEAAPTVEDVVSRGIRAVSDQAVELIVVDYIQLLTCQERYSNEVLRVGHVAKMLKELARRAEVPVLALSQITIGEGGAIRTRWATEVEFHADALVLLLRDQKFEGNRDTEPDRAMRTLRITKNRFGPQRAVKLTFNKPLLRFEEVDDGTAGGIIEGAEENHVGNATQSRLRGQTGEAPGGARRPDPEVRGAAEDAGQGADSGSALAEGEDVPDDVIPF